MKKPDERFEQLLLGALGIFMKYGIRSVTMDDLARHLSISKKTIYKYVTDKNDLVMKCMAFQQEQEHCAMEACMNRDHNAIDENFEISKVILDQLKNIHPSVMYDLEKYYPEALGQFDHYKQTVVRGWIENNMKKGIEEGLYRTDINIPILTALYLSRMDDFFKPEKFPEGYTFRDIYLEQFIYHIRGLASKKGVEYLENKLKNEQA